MKSHLIQHTIKIVSRHLFKNKLFSAINILGLSVGLAIAFFIALFILNELSFENMHKKNEHIFRLSMHIQNANYDIHWARTNLDWTKNLPETFPEIEHLVRFQDYYPRNVKFEEDTYKIKHAYSVDSNVFEVFDFKLLHGNPQTALVEPRSTVVTQSTAELLFGKEDPIDKEIEILDNTGKQKTIYKVTGVMADVASNTHLPVNMLTSFASEAERTGWAYTYLLLKNASNKDVLQDKIPDFIANNVDEATASTITLPLQKLKDIHLHSALAREIIPNGKISRLFFFGTVGIFILLMSGINYINLNVAQSLRRLREIGVRKALGSSRINLIIYFLIEANIITLLAALLGVMLVFLFLPAFKAFTLITTPVMYIIPFALIIALLIGNIAGYYPAFVLSKQKVVSAIKQKEGFTPGKRNLNIKNVLVAFQLVLCTVLISSALITKSQFQFLVEKDLGLEKEQTLVITDIPKSVKFKYDIFKNQLNQLSTVKGVTASMQVPSSEIRDTGDVYAEGATEDLENLPVMDIQVVDQDFITQMSVELLAGNNFTDKRNTILEESINDNLLDYIQQQPREYIINETALHNLGWKNPVEALDKQLSWRIGNIQLQQGPIVGVIRDYHQESLRNKIEPLVMISEPVWVNNFLVKVSSNNIQQAIAEIESLWKENFPDLPLSYNFLDELYNQLYETEKKQLQLIYIFSGLAIFIAFLGIFGLISYTLKTKEKELAIRKVLGANLSNTILLLGKKFMLFMLLGIVLAVPLTWLSMEKWLENFMYRIEIDPLTFLIAVVAILFALIVTITLQMHKTGKNNIASTLRVD
ncbi:MAG: FtsX-like permease family protein [Bacteroidota bacterium]